MRGSREAVGVRQPFCTLVVAFTRAYGTVVRDARRAVLLPPIRAMKRGFQKSPYCQIAHATLGEEPGASASSRQSFQSGASWSQLLLSSVERGHQLPQAQPGAGSAPTVPLALQPSLLVPADGSSLHTAWWCGCRLTPGRRGGRRRPRATRSGRGSHRHWCSRPAPVSGRGRASAPPPALPSLCARCG